MTAMRVKNAQHSARTSERDQILPEISEWFNAARRYLSPPADMKPAGGLHVEVQHEAILLGTGATWRAQRMESREFDRSEEHTSELQSLMRISYAVFCLK